MSDDFYSCESVEWNLPLDVFYLKPLLNIVATAIKYMTINKQCVTCWLCLKFLGYVYYVILALSKTYPNMYEYDFFHAFS